jgi:hypothetical protein
VRTGRAGGRRRDKSLETQGARDVWGRKDAGNTGGKWFQGLDGGAIGALNLALVPLEALEATTHDAGLRAALDTNTQSTRGASGQSLRPPAKP